MDIPLYIDTTVKSPTTVYGTNSDFTVIVSGDGMLLENTDENYMALKSITLSYRWNNIDSTKFNNNTMRYSADNGTTFKTITFPDGNYTYSDISNCINNYLESQNDSKTGIQLYYVSSLKKTFIELEENFRVDFRSNTAFAKLIGFASSSAIITASSYSPDTPDITNSIDKILNHCSLLNDMFYNGNLNSDVLYMFETSDFRIGYTIKIEPKNLKYHKLNNYLIKKMRIEIKDSLGRYIDLQDPISMVLFIRSF